MKDLIYQNTAVKELSDISIKYIQDEDPKLIILQAPTGSGKTIMLASFLSQIVKSLQSKKSLAFVWISVNYLHEQSKDKLEKYFRNERLLNCVTINEIQNNQIDENEILFVNWESLNREGSVFMVDNERDWNLSKVVNNTKDEDRELILVIDESHRAAKTSKAKDIIDIIDPKLTIEVSATPKEGITNDHKVTVKLSDVIDEGMIKEEIQINPGLVKVETNEDIIKAALKKRRELQKDYANIKSKVNPLLLVQIPRKKSTDVRSPEDKIMDLLEKQGITTKNGKLAVWLSDKDKKINLNYLEKNDSDIAVLVFKEAIAVGWDCPRACILLLQREWNAENYIFNIQTLGRIMRMPKHMHYEKYPALNKGYVYTASDNFSIVEDLADDYVSLVQMLRDNEAYGNINLPSDHIRRKREKQRLSGKFKDCLFKAADELKINKSKINIGLVKFKKAIGVNGHVENIDKAQTIPFKSRGEIEKDREEICAWYTSFIKSQTLPFTGGDRPTTIIKSSLRSLFKKLFGKDNEDEIGMIVLNPRNRSIFEQLIDIAKQKYTQLPEKQDIVNKNEEWQIPDMVSVFDNFEKITINNKLIRKSVLKPFYQKKEKSGKLQWSKPEKVFIEGLEKTDDDVLWWFKNCERESKYFGISYKKNDGHYYGFYPDFIVKTKKDILIIEIKDDKDFKNENLLKLNAGKEYQKKYKRKENLYFFIISPLDYFNFFKTLKDQELPTFKSKYEENLIRYTQSRKVTSEKVKERDKEDQELLDLYDEELSKAIKNLDDKKFENNILKIDLENAQAIIKGLKESLVYRGKASQKEEQLTVPQPFNICILGESIDKETTRKKLREYFEKYGVKAIKWDIDFYGNTRLKNTDILRKLKKGQSKFNVIITGQLYFHSGRDNKSANLLTELKKGKYIDHIIGCSPKELLTCDNIVEKLNYYLVESST
jgi:type III restriction enzyme